MTRGLIERIFSGFGKKNDKVEEKATETVEGKVEEQDTPENGKKKTGLETIAEEELLRRYSATFNGPKTTELDNSRRRKIAYEMGNRVLAKYHDDSLVICSIHENDSLKTYPGRVMFHTESSDFSGLFGYDDGFGKKLNSITFEYIRIPFKTEEYYSMNVDENLSKTIRPATQEEVIELLKNMAKEYKPNLKSTDLSEAMKAREYAFFKRNIDKVRRWNPENKYFNMCPEFSKTHYIAGLSSDKGDLFEEKTWKDMELRPIITEIESCEGRVNGLISYLLRDPEFCNEFNPPRGKDGKFYMDIYSVPKEAYAIIEANHPLILGANYRRA